jgi:hypothetical protein
MSMRHSSKARLNNQKKTDDEMIKHDHENESSQIISAKDKFESYFSDHISHFETRRKTRYQHILAAIRLSIHCKQTLIRESSLGRTHRNSDSFTESHQAVHKRKIAASKKAYNRHVLEEKRDRNFQDKTFIFIYYRLLF